MGPNLMGIVPFGTIRRPLLDYVLRVLSQEANTSFFLGRFRPIPYIKMAKRPFRTVWHIARRDIGIYQTLCLCGYYRMRESSKMAHGAFRNFSSVFSNPKFLVWQKKIIINSYFENISCLFEKMVGKFLHIITFL